MRYKSLALMAAGTLLAAFMLSGCAFTEALSGGDSTPRQQAYALALDYRALQETAIAYVENGKPSPVVAQSIADANNVAGGLVVATVKQAKRLEAAQAGEAAPTEVGSVDNVAAQESTFARLYGLAKTAVDRFAALVGGGAS